MTHSINLNSLDLAMYNQQLADKTATQVVEWVAEHAQNPIITTNFRPQTSAILHLVSQIIPNIKVLWIDSGYNTDATLDYAHQLIELLTLNVSIYHPQPSEELEYFKKNGIPQYVENGDNSAHERFSKIVKIDPFVKGLNELNPDAWFTGIRKDQTDFRKSLDTLSYSKQGLLKVAPLFHWSKEQQLAYITEHGLPDNRSYFDPTKAHEHSECGIQLL